MFFFINSASNYCIQLYLLAEFHREFFCKTPFCEN